MKILVACEESQAVCKAFRKKGHDAYSCDLLPCSGGHPEWHILGDVTILLNGNCHFFTMTGKHHFIEKWDMIIAFPPCTDLASSGARWFKEKQADGRQEKSIEFFLRFTRLDVPKLVIENPVGIMSTHYRTPDQIINPYQFGDPFEKKTCLWLKGVEKLIPSNVVEVPPRVVYASGKTLPEWYAKAWHLPKEELARLRSKTFPGIANAMAEQWG